MNSSTNNIAGIYSEVTGDKWDERFLRLAKHISEWSKDPSTRVGAVLVKDKHVIAMGYNGFAKFLPDNKELYLDREYKLKKMIHAEENAIYNAFTSVVGATLYVWGLPVCEQCAQKVINAGISHVVIPSSMNAGTDSLSLSRWAQSCREGKRDMNLASITCMAIKRV